MGSSILPRRPATGLGAESLLDLRGVDAGQPHLVLDVGGVHRSERVAVVNRNDFPLDGCSGHRAGDEDGPQGSHGANLRPKPKVHPHWHIKHGSASENLSSLAC
jgi:hypothetical protein